MAKQFKIKLKIWHVHFKKTNLENIISKRNAIIMGRKTFDSIGRALPNRLNYILSKIPLQLP